MVDRYIKNDDGSAEYSYYDTYNTRAWTESRYTLDAEGNVIGQIFIADENTELTNDGSSVVQSGTSLGETINGGTSSDAIFSYGGNDTLFGGGNNDWLDGGVGSDQIYGGAGNDTIVFDAADNLQFVNGGDGFDALFFYDEWQDIDLAAHGFEVSQLHRVDAGSADWTSITETFDSEGYIYDRYTKYDDGSGGYSIFDSHDAQPWTELRLNLDASGNLS